MALFELASIWYNIRHKLYLLVFMKRPFIAIIILNWNGKEHLSVCLRSVLRQSLPSSDYQIWLVDNGSTDGSVDYVKEYFPSVKIIALDSNTGFAEGNNIGIRQALVEKNIRFIVTLNNDTEVDMYWLESLLAVAISDKHIGAVCSKMLFYNQRNIIDSAGDYILSGTLKVVTRGYKEEDKGQYNTVEECFSARAGAALYRREMLEDIQQGEDYFDSKFFAYIEDVDLSVRARLRNWKIMYAPKAIVYHKVSATTKKISYLFRRFQAGRNRIFLASKNYPVRWWRSALKGRESVDGEHVIAPVQEVWLYLKIAYSALGHLPYLIMARKTMQKRRKISRMAMNDWLKNYSIEKNK